MKYILSALVGVMSFSAVAQIRMESTLKQGERVAQETFIIQENEEAYTQIGSLLFELRANVANAEASHASLTLSIYKMDTENNKSEKIAEETKVVAWDESASFVCPAPGVNASLEFVPHKE